MGIITDLRPQLIWRSSSEIIYRKELKIKFRKYIQWNFVSQKHKKVQKRPAPYKKGQLFYEFTIETPRFLIKKGHQLKVLKIKDRSQKNHKNRKFSLSLSCISSNFK